MWANWGHCIISTYIGLIKIVFNLPTLVIITSITILKFSILKFYVNVHLKSSFLDRCDRPLISGEKFTGRTGCSNCCCYLDNPKGPIFLFWAYQTVRAYVNPDPENNKQIKICFSWTLLLSRNPRNKVLILFRMK